MYISGILIMFEIENETHLLNIGVLKVKGLVFQSRSLDNVFLTSTTTS